MCSSAAAHYVVSLCGPACLISTAMDSSFLMTPRIPRRMAFDLRPPEFGFLPSHRSTPFWGWLTGWPVCWSACLVTKTVDCYFAQRGKVSTLTGRASCVFQWQRWHLHLQTCKTATLRTVQLCGWCMLLLTALFSLPQVLCCLAGTITPALPTIFWKISSPSGRNISNRLKSSVNQRQHICHLFPVS